MSSVRQLADVLDAVERTGRTASVTVKVDTGLNRNGVSAAEFPALLTAAAPRQRRRRHPAARHHVASGCTATTPTIRSMTFRRSVLTDLRGARPRSGVGFEIAHLCNSPAAMTRPDLAFDMVRPGIAVYGQTPIPERGDMGLRPAMTLKCPVARVQSVRRATVFPTVTRGSPNATRRWRCCRSAMPTASTAALSGRIDVLINGRLRSQRRPHLHGPVRRRPWPGEIDVAEGDEAILFGPGTQGEQTAQDWADLLGTINYEVVTSPRGRVIERIVERRRAKAVER